MDTPDEAITNCDAKYVFLFTALKEKNKLCDKALPMFVFL